MKFNIYHFFSRWSFDQALDFMIEKTFMDPKMLEVECKRYVTFPGQACAYKVGELKLKQLRKKAKSALGMNTL